MADLARDYLLPKDAPSQPRDADTWLLIEVLRERVRRGLFRFKDTASLEVIREWGWALKDMRHPQRRRGRLVRASPPQEGDTQAGDAFVATEGEMPLCGVPGPSPHTPPTVNGRAGTARGQAESEVFAVEHPPAGKSSREVSLMLRRLETRAQHAAAVHMNVLDLAFYVKAWTKQPPDEQKTTALEFLVLQWFFLETGHVFRPLNLGAFCGQPSTAAAQRIRAWREAKNLAWDLNSQDEGLWRYAQDAVEKLFRGEAGPSEQISHWLAVRIDSETRMNIATVRKSKFFTQWRAIGLGGTWVDNPE